VDGQSDREIAPGGSETVKVTIASTNLAGPYTKVVTVTGNDPAQPKATLTVRGKVLVPIQVTPRLANFGKLPDAASPAPVVVTIRRGDGGPIDPRITNAVRPGIQGELRVVKPGDHYELTVWLDPPQKPGQLRSREPLTTGVPEVPSRTVPVYADVPPSWAGVAATE